jgi:GcrA cell cycle regulator
MSFTWTEDYVALLREAWGRGDSGSVIAATFSEMSGQKVTRNMVMGKLNREHLTRNPQGKRPPKEPGMARSVRIREPKPPINGDTNPLPLQLPPDHPLALPVATVEPCPENHETEPGDPNPPASPMSEDGREDDGRPLGAKDIFELRGSDCRWPLGGMMEPVKFFCAQEAVIGQPYCDEHCKRAFTVRPPRIRTPRQ